MRPVCGGMCRTRRTHTHTPVPQSVTAADKHSFPRGRVAMMIDRLEDSVSHRTLSALGDVIVLPGTSLMQQIQNHQRRESEKAKGPFFTS